MQSQQYVLGLLLDQKGRVALVRKNRPEWQAGLLNGIGGKVERGEHPAEAMVREFKEEAGADIGGWYSFGVMDGSFGMVHLFRACVEDLDTIGIKTMTDEPIEIHTIDAVYNDKSIGVLYNVQMLLRVAESLDLVYTTFQY